MGLNDVVVFHRRTTGSTNDDARALVSSARFDPASPAAIVVAETQTKGRGRGSNVWLSPNGSISLTITAAGVEAARLGVLPLGVGTAVVAALRRVGANAAVKWPNDVLVDGRKVCGILCESSLLAGAARVFIGIGINCDTASFDLEVASRATTLADHGLTVDRPALVADITSRVLALLRGKATTPEIVLAWKAVSVPWWGEEVTYLEGDAQKRVILLDVNPDGQLVVRDETGVVRSLLSGEVQRMRPLGD